MLPFPFSRVFFFSFIPFVAFCRFASLPEPSRVRPSLCISVPYTERILMLLRFFALFFYCAPTSYDSSVRPSDSVVWAGPMHTRLDFNADFMIRWQGKSSASRTFRLYSSLLTTHTQRELHTPKGYRRARLDRYYFFLLLFFCFIFCSPIFARLIHTHWS